MYIITIWFIFMIFVTITPRVTAQGTETSLFFLLEHSKALTTTCVPKGRNTAPAPGPSQGAQAPAQNLCALRDKPGSQGCRYRNPGTRSIRHREKKAAREADETAPWCQAAGGWANSGTTSKETLAPTPLPRRSPYLHAAPSQPAKRPSEEEQGQAGSQISGAAGWGTSWGWGTPEGVGRLSQVVLELPPNRNSHSLPFYFLFYSSSILCLILFSIPFRSPVWLGHPAQPANLPAWK